MKVKNKGKIHPTPPPPPAGDSFSVLKLLPAAILALISVLSLQDRHVLAYMLTRSIQSPNPPSFDQKQRNGGKRLITSSYNHHHHHKPPLFDCDCFDCYTWYWFKWDSSPNRELIHQAIEAFEEHALAGELSPRKKGKKREKMSGGGGRRLSGKCDDCSPESGSSSPGYCVSAAAPLKAEGYEVVEVKQVPAGDLFEEVAPPPATSANVVAVAAAAEIHHKGLARKVLPDVLGLLNSRLWSLWSPNV